MRGVTIQCLFYGSLISGIWTALLCFYIHHNHVSNLEKKSQGPALIWSLGKKLQQQITHNPKQIPRPRVRFETPDEDETTEYKTFLKLRKYVDFLLLAILRGKYTINLIFGRGKECLSLEQFGF